MSIIRKSNAPFFLFVNSVLWGSSYVWSKMLLGYLPRFFILFICSLGGLVSTVLLFYPSIKSLNRKAVLSSAVISMLPIVSNTFFMFALQHTSSSNTAFIVQMSVIITPIIMALLDKKMPEGKIILSALVALSGMFLLTCDFGSFRLNTGDLLALGNAVFFSLYLAGLNFNSKKIGPVQFTFIQHATNSIVFLAIAIAFERQFISLQRLDNLFVALITASICVTVITVLIQSTAIKYVRPEKATLIYTLEPVSTLLLASVLIGEKPDGIKAIIGCLLILFSVILSLYRPKEKRRAFSAEPSIKPLME